MPAARKTAEPAGRILITGASGELGAALARHYAPSGRTLLLWGRDMTRLAAVAEACRRVGAEVNTRSVDLTNSAAAIAAIEADDDAAPVDLALFVAGLGDIRADHALVEDPAQVVRLGLVNFVTPSAMAAALAARMALRQRGGIVMIGSAAADHDLPFAAAYAASKAGLARFAHSLRIGMAPHGVAVTLVSPGFIDTAAGRKVAGKKPFLMQSADVAARIARAAARGQAHIVLPWPFVLVRIATRLMPRRWRDRMLLGLSPPKD